MRTLGPGPPSCPSPLHPTSHLTPPGHSLPSTVQARTTPSGRAELCSPPSRQEETISQTTPQSRLYKRDVRCICSTDVCSTALVPSPATKNVVLTQGLALSQLKRSCLWLDISLEGPCPTPALCWTIYTTLWYPLGQAQGSPPACSVNGCEVRAKARHHKGHQ